MCHDIENTEDGDLECEKWNRVVKERHLHVFARHTISRVYNPEKNSKDKISRILYNKTDNDRKHVQQ